MKEKKIVLFDGGCSFCNYWVRFIFNHNKKKDIYFMTLQDERVAELLPFKPEPNALDSVIYYRQGEVYTHSTAALKIGRELNLGYKILSNLGLVIPKIIRDSIYNFVGRKRYNWFGKTDTIGSYSKNCPLPTLEFKKQLL